LTIILHRNEASGSVFVLAKRRLIMPQIHWTELGSPTQPGLVNAPGYGPLMVEQRQIDAAAQFGGRCSFQIDDTGHHLRNTDTRWRLGVLPDAD
jgi:hypothetical protein